MKTAWHTAKKLAGIKARWHDLRHTAVEFIVFIDGVLRYSQLFHGKKLTDYPSTLNARAKQFAEKGWIEQVPLGHRL